MLTHGNAGDADWPVHDGDKRGTRYSELDQINASNVGTLELAWTYRTGAMDRHSDIFSLSREQNIPIRAAGSDRGHAVRLPGCPAGIFSRGTVFETSLGTPTIGGPIVTAGDLIFIASTADRVLRAFHIETGKQLWRVKLPAVTMTTPITYQVGGRQYIVIVSGGHNRIPGARGDYVLGHALPR